MIPEVCKCLSKGTASSADWMITLQITNHFESLWKKLIFFKIVKIISFRIIIKKTYSEYLKVGSNTWSPRVLSAGACLIVLTNLQLIFIIASFKKINLNLKNLKNLQTTKFSHVLKNKRFDAIQIGGIENNSFFLCIWWDENNRFTTKGIQDNSLVQTLKKK